MNRSHRSFRRASMLLVALLAFAIAAPAVASAQNIDTGPTGEQYGNGVLGIAAGGSETPPPPPSNPPSSSSGGGGISSLPFTGLDVAAIAAIGLGMVGAGFVVRRAARTSDAT